MSYLDENGVLYLWGKIKTALSGKVDKADGKVLSSNDYTTAEKNKLSGIAEGANKTTVDTALSSTSTNPVQNKAVNTALGNKVDKVTGKGLSTNDYTTDEKNKLAGLANYSLPTASATVLGGVKVGSGLSISSGVLSATGGGKADSVDWANVNGKPTKVSQFTNDSGFQTATQVESTVTSKIQTVVGTAPEALDTLKELADALGNDADFAGTMTTQLASKVNASDSITNAEIDTLCTW